jgi:uncharacterized protein (DUF697 family)
MTLLAVYEKVESLLKKLPEGLHRPILRELEPLKTLFLEQRPPRLVLLGDRTVSRAALVNNLYDAEAARPTEDIGQSGTWENFVVAGRGSLQVLDARRPIALPILSRPLATQVPDLYLFVRGSAAIDEACAADLDHAVDVLAFADGQSSDRPKLLGVQVGAQAGEDQRLELHGALFTKPEVAERTAGALLDSDRARLVEQIAIELPPVAQLEMARLSRNRELQRQIAGVLIKSVTAISGAIGAQPIPLADFPILTSLQGTMVASIAHISGREFNAKAAGEFLAAVGASIGAGLVFREGARAAAKLIPGWGNAISGGVAATGTYTVGRAAVAYFIDGVSLKDARQIFRRGKRSGMLKEVACEACPVRSSPHASAVLLSAAPDEAFHDSSDTLLAG